MTRLDDSAIVGCVTKRSAEATWQHVIRQKALARAARFWGMLVIGLGVLAMSPPLRAQRKVIRLEAIKVEGRIQKPQAFYILQRSNLNFEGLELKQSFIPKIIRSVEEQPF